MKEVNLSTKGPEAKEDPLNPKFVNPDDKEKIETKEDEFPPVPYFSLFRYGTAYDKFLLFIGTMSAVATAVCQPLNMLVFGDLTGHMIAYAMSEKDNTAKDNLAEAIIWFVIYNCAIGVGMLVFSYISTLLFNYTGIRQSFRIRSLYLERVLNQDVSWYDVHQSGDFASRMGDDLLKLEEGIGEKVVMFLHFQLSFVGSLVMALIKGWELALICLISLPVTMVAMGVVAYLTSKLSKNELEAYGSAGTIAEEVFTIIRTVLAFGGQKKEQSRYEKHLIFARDNNIRRSMLTGIGFGILWFCIYASYALAFWYGVGLIINERHEDPADRTYTPGNMVTVFFSVMSGSMNFGMASPYIEVFGVARGAAAKIFGVIDAIPKINSSKGKGVQPDKFEGNIVFENIKFNYPSRPDVEILRGLNLSIKAGQTVALVGSSGCGKSTCIQLIQRFYDPEVGTVYLDGHDLTTLDLSLLRTNIGVVGQEPVLFGTTIAENIRYGYKWATMEDIERAAKKANAHKFISALPEGYNTMVGERGAQLSGGQKQRIAIARALVREPSILLLDEATSALDTNSEAKVQAALDNASKDCTTIIIAHRLSTIRGANRIVVIKEGQAVEDGTHAELMALQKDYYNLVTNQVATVDDDDNQVNAFDANDDEDDITPQHTGPREVEEQDDLTKDVSLMKVLSLNKPESIQIVIGVIASVFMGFAMPIFAVLFGDILGVLQYESDKKVRDETNIYCIFFVVAGVGAGVATFLQIFMFGDAGEKLVMRMRSEMFGAMLRQEIGWYDRKENGVGALCAKLSSEVANIQGATGQRIGTIFQSIATLALSLGLSMYYEWRLGLLALAFAPIIMISVYLQQKMMMNETVGYRKSLENSTKLAVEAVSQIRTVASLGNESTFHGKYVEELLPYIKKAKFNTHYRAGVLSIARSIMFFAFAVCMYYGGYLIRTEGLSYENVLKVTQSLIMGTITIANALAFTPNFQKGLVAASKVFKLLQRVPKVKDPDSPIVQDSYYGDINYSSIEFKYPTRPDTKILKGLNLLIERGQTIALVGPSGCGKSTIIQLIERFYDPSSGTVSINNNDVKSIRLTDLRLNLGIVSQEPNLFDRTIAENIAYGDNSREVTEAEVIDAAKQANVHNFIVGLPLGYGTPLGDKGTQLSGGQKQRVAIARALVRNPQILLLDEATSALDTESEKIVQEALDKAKQGRTCITIAHRLSTIQNADVICVINEGVVHEMGTHTQLLAQKGIYHHLYSLQNGKR